MVSSTLRVDEQIALLTCAVQCYGVRDGVRRVNGDDDKTAMGGQTYMDGSHSGLELSTGCTVGTSTDTINGT